MTISDINTWSVSPLRHKTLKPTHKINWHENADVIISNNVGDQSIGFSSDDNELTMHFKNKDMVNIKKGKK